MNQPRNRLAAVVREPVTLAIVVAVLVTGALAILVFVIWSGTPDASDPRLVAPAPQGALTPTPRAVNWPRPTSTPDSDQGSPRARAPESAPASVVTPNAASVPAINPVSQPTATLSPTAAPTATAAPEPTTAATATPSPAPTQTPVLTATPAAAPDFSADDGASFAPLAGGGWTIRGDQLVHDSPQPQTEPLLLVPYQTPSGDFAIEAEIKVDGLAQGVCNQSFGVVAGSPSMALFWGGGVIYSCGSTTPAARITDVSDWTNGYDQDRQLARGNFNPEAEWHRYRLEVRGDELRLLIDGEEILTTTDPALVGGLNTGQTGLWSQGVQLTVRSLAIFAL
jgi:hypothetical protein